MPVNDKRLDRSCGHYPSREALNTACTEYRAQGLSNNAISNIVGVSASTISRMLNGDKPTYTRSTASVAPVIPKTLTEMYKAWKPPCLKDIVEPY